VYSTFVLVKYGSNRRHVPSYFVLSYESTKVHSKVLSYFRTFVVFIITYCTVLSYYFIRRYEGTVSIFVRTYMYVYENIFESTKVFIYFESTRVRKYNYVMKVRTYVRVQTGTRTVLHRVAYYVRGLFVVRSARF
jgi:hypothetical protein